MNIFHLHPLKGDRHGQLALDIDGRNSEYRLIIVPIDTKGYKLLEKDINIVYKTTEIIIIWEVTKHYE